MDSMIDDQTAASSHPPQLLGRLALAGAEQRCPVGIHWLMWTAAGANPISGSQLSDVAEAEQPIIPPRLCAVHKVCGGSALSVRQVDDPGAWEDLKAVPRRRQSERIYKLVGAIALEQLWILRKSIVSANHDVWLVDIGVPVHAKRGLT
jgi:hypothetical protein